MEQNDKSVNLGNGKNGNNSKNDESFHLGNGGGNKNKKNEEKGHEHKQTCKEKTCTKSTKKKTATIHHATTRANTGYHQSPTITRDSTLTTNLPSSTENSTLTASTYSHRLTDVDVHGFTTDANLTLPPKSSNDVPPTPSPQTTLFIGIGFGISGFFFLLILYLCFVICRKKTNAKNETYNQYSHVDQSEFLDPPPRDHARLSAINTGYEAVDIPMFEKDLSDVKSSKESGYSEAEDFNGHSNSEKPQHPQTVVIGPQFSELKENHCNPSAGVQKPPASSPVSEASPTNSGDENYFTIQPASSEKPPASSPVSEASKFTFSPTNSGEENYFTLQPTSSENAMSPENGQEDLPDYFVLEKSN